MPKIHSGGVSNRIVDPDYIAPSGTPVETALDQGMSDQGKPSEDQPDTERTGDEGNQPERDERNTTDDDRRPEPDNETPPFDMKKSAAKSTPAKKK